MANEKDIKTLRGKVDKAGKRFTEEPGSKHWVLYSSPYQAKPTLVSLSEYAGHKVSVTYEKREGDSAYGCDVGTGAG